MHGRMQEYTPQYTAMMNAYASAMKEYFRDPSVYDTKIKPILAQLTRYDEMVSPMKARMHEYTKHLTSSALDRVSANPMHSDKGSFTFTGENIGNAQYTVDQIKRIMHPDIFDNLVVTIQVNDTVQQSRVQPLSTGYLVTLPSQYTTGDVAHEIGHVIEMYKPDIMVRAKQFQASRTRGENYQLLSKIMPEHAYDSEYCRAGNFPDPYCGKITKDGSTEVFAMGLEFMVIDPITFAHVDPEYFQMILDCIRGV